MLPSTTSGSTKPNTTGTAQAVTAPAAAQPPSGCGGSRPPLEG